MRRDFQQMSGLYKWLISHQALVSFHYLTLKAGSPAEIYSDHLTC